MHVHLVCYYRYQILLYLRFVLVYSTRVRYSDCLMLSNHNLNHVNIYPVLTRRGRFFYIRSFASSIIRTYVYRNEYHALNILYTFAYKIFHLCIFKFPLMYKHPWYGNKFPKGQ